MHTNNLPRRSVDSGAYKFVAHLPKCRDCRMARPFSKRPFMLYRKQKIMRWKRPYPLGMFFLSVCIVILGRNKAGGLPLLTLSTLYANIACLRATGIISLPTQYQSETLKYLLMLHMWSFPPVKLPRSTFTSSPACTLNCYGSKLVYCPIKGTRVLGKYWSLQVFHLIAKLPGTSEHLGRQRRVFQPSSQTQGRSRLLFAGVLGLSGSQAS